MKKILCLVSAFVIVFSFSVPVSAATENRLVYEFDAEWFLNRLPDNGVITEDGYYTVTVWTGGAFGFKISNMLNPDSTYFYTIDGEFTIRETSNFNTLKPNVEFTNAQSVTFGLYKVGAKIKNLKIYEVLEVPDPPPFGQGGLAGDSTDLHYGVEVVTDVFNKLWNVLTDYWWVMVGLCLPIAFYLLCILTDLFKKSPKARFKPKLYSSGYYSGKRAYSPNSSTFDISYNTLERRRRRKGKGGGLDISKYEVFEIDGITYYRSKKKKKSDRETSNFYKDDLFTYKDCQWYSGGKAVSGGSGNPIQRKKPVNVDIEVDE